ncbi:thioredoxin [Clostridia bacterium]|nr:thioredoxin [Clostridia bacterium]
MNKPEINIPKKGISILKFQSPMCAPCRALSAVLDEVDDIIDAVLIPIDVFTEDGGIIANKYEVRNLPTLIFFKDGEIRERKSGVISKDDILTILGAL